MRTVPRRVPGRRAVAALCLAAALGCAPPPPDNRVTFRVTPRLSSFVAYYAADAGYFAAEGIDVRLVAWDNSEAILPALAQGGLDASTVWRLDPAYLNLMARGGRVRLVEANLVYAPGECGYAAFVARPELVDSGRLRRLEDLRGLRIPTERTATSFYVWSRLLERAGLTLADVRPVNVPTNARDEELAKGLIDVATTSEPDRTRLLRAGRARLWLPVSEVLPGLQNGFIAFGRRLLDERRDLGVRFLRAYQRAVRDYLAHGRTPRLLEIVARHTRIEPAELASLCWPSFSPDGMVDPATVDDFQQWAHAQGLIDHPQPLDAIFDAGFLRAAAAPER